MTDVATKQRLTVTPHDLFPFIDVPFVQLDDLQKLLDRHHIPYSVQEDVISIDDGPEIAAIDLGRGVDPASVQALLDAAP